MYPIETSSLIWGYGPGASSGLLDTADWVCLKNAKGCWIYITEDGNNATTMTLTVHESVDGSGTTALAIPWHLYANLLTTTSDAWVRRTDAITYDLVPSAVAKMVAFYIDATILTPGCDWIQLGASAGHANNHVDVKYQLVGLRYQQATPPTAIA